MAITDLSKKVRVYNNVFNEVVFENTTGRVSRLQKNGAFKDVSIEDLDYINAIAPAMLIEGILYIEDEEARIHLEINDLYKNGNIVKSSELEKILKQSPEKMKKSLSKISKTAKKEVANLAKEKSKELTGGQKEVIEKETEVEIDEKF